MSLLPRPCPVSSHPGPPLLGLGGDFHSSRAGTRETSTLWSCPSNLRGSQVKSCSARVLQELLETQQSSLGQVLHGGPVLWRRGKPAVPPGLAL